MKPPPFAYAAPRTVEEAVELIAAGDGTRLLAGGQSLVPLMKFRQVRPATLVDINRVAGLDTIEERDGELVVGALVRQQRLLEDEVVRRGWPLLSEAIQYVGYLATRHRGTVGGSLAFAAPWAELGACAVALDAAIDVRSRRGARTIAAREFFLAPNRTALEPDEMVVALRCPAVAARTGAGFHEVSVRFRDYAQLAAAALVTLGPGDVVAGAELVLLRMGPAPHRVDLSGMVGSALDDEALDAVAAAVSVLDADDDIEASAAHRRRVAPVLARRALRDAARRASEEETA